MPPGAIGRSWTVDLIRKRGSRQLVAIIDSLLHNSSFTIFLFVWAGLLHCSFPVCSAGCCYCDDILPRHLVPTPSILSQHLCYFFLPTSCVVVFSFVSRWGVLQRVMMLLRNVCQSG
ncbi:hypothetical protein BGZ60DRAFT_280711 [Tricladium varicosporioides]|nr:hypothetical protein BGZ60DRAFT_280711 [Hymenoscyphus varicosporioides]